MRRQRVGGLTGLALALTLEACGTASPPPVWRWDKAGATQEVFERERYFCLRGATSRDNFYGSSRFDTDRFVTCMTARGYTRSPTGQFGASPP